MEAGRCVEVLDPYQWMPGHGENSVEVFMERSGFTVSDLVVTVSYDGEDGKEQQKKITFTNVSAFYRGSFPGPAMLRITHSTENKENISIGSLVEYPESEAAQAWIKHYKNHSHYERAVKHYMWIFLSENVMLEVFAEGVQWENLV